VKSKQEWLRKTARYYQKLRDQCGGFDRNSLLYRGDRYQALVVSDGHFAATVSDSLKTITFHVPDRRRVRIYQQEWFKQQTDSIIRERLPALAEKMGLKYNRVSVKRQKSRWGSCSRKGNLNFNLMLAAAPPAVVDYVIIHELAHLRVLDHSTKFWALVQAMDPGYLAHREWLSSYAPLIKLG
jgi:predicted metal-dependent hydrolase